MRFSLLRNSQLAEGEGIEPSPLPGRGFQDRLSTMDATLLSSFLAFIAQGFQLIMHDGQPKP